MTHPPAEPTQCCDSSDGPRQPPLVRLQSGEFIWQNRDLHVAGRGIDFEWIVHYRSQPLTGQPHWDHSYRLRAWHAAGGIAVSNGNGSMDLYVDDGSGAHRADGVFAEGRIQRGALRIRFSGGGSWAFRAFGAAVAPGCIDRIEDHNGNALKFDYDAHGHLSGIVDALERRFRIRCDGEGRVVSVADFTRRRVCYRFGAAGELVSIVYPNVVATPAGNDFPDGAERRFRYARGLLVGISDRAGKPSVSIGYSRSGTGVAVTSVRRYADKPTAIRYAAEGACGLAVVEDPAGNTRDFLFDRGGDCVRVRVHSSEAVYETRYAYTTPDRLLARIELPNGGVVRREYELERRPDASAIERGNLRAIRVEPGPQGASQPVLARSFDYLPGHGCSCAQAFVTRETDYAGAVTVREFDARGNLSRLLAADGLETRYRRNAFGDVVERVLGAGGGVDERVDRLSYSPDHGQRIAETLDANGLRSTTSYGYDELGRLLTLCDPEGHEQRHTWTAWDRVAHRSLADGTTEDLAYDADNRIAARIVIEGGARICQTVRRDRAGRVVALATEMGEAGKETRPANRGHRSIVVQSATVLEDGTRSVRDGGSSIDGGRSGRAIVSVTRDAAGNPVAITQGQDDEASTTRTSYDGYGRAVRVELPDGATTNFERDGHGNVIRLDRRAAGDETPFETVTQSFDAGGRMLRRAVVRSGHVSVDTWCFDVRGRLVASRVGGIEVKRRYDSLDRLVRSTENGTSTEFVFDGNSNVIGERKDGRQRTTTLDARGRPVRVEGPGAWFREVRYGPRDRPESVKTPGRHTTFEQDAIGRLIGATLNEGNGASLRLDWDVASRLAGLRDPEGHETRYEFDRLGNPSAVVHADGTATRRQFDSRGNCISWLDANGTVVRNTFDVSNRLVRREITPAEGVANDTTSESYAYDAQGRLVAASNDAHVIRRRFDDADGGVVEAQDDREVRSVFDRDGRRASVTYPSGYELTFEHKGGVRRISDRSGVAVEIAEGQIRYPRIDLLSKATWNSQGHPKRLVVSVAGRPIVDRRHGWSAGGHLTRVEERGPGKPMIRAMALDDSGRIAESVDDAGGAVRYGLDAAGNRKTVERGSRVDRYAMRGSDRAMNRYTSTPQGEQTHDRNGNLLSVTDASGTCRMRYDYRNRMVGYRSAVGEVTRYSYDCFDRRISKSVAGVVTQYAYDDQRLVETRDDASGIVRSLLRDEIGVHAVSTQGAEAWLVCDLQGSPLVEMDARGEIRRSFRYDDFGVVSVFDAAGVPAAPTADLPPTLYAGYTFDAESGFLRAGVRYLDPRAGRFTTPDPMGAWFDPLARGNAYAYAANNPASFHDPSGLSVSRSYSCRGPWPGPRTIYVEYQGCSRAHRDELSTPVCRAFRGAGWAKQAVIDLWWGDMTGDTQPGASVTRSQLGHWFAGPDGAVSLSSKATIGSRLEKIYNAIKSDDFDIDCESSGGTCDYAAAYVAWGGYDVNLCPGFWSSISDNTKAYVLIHELSHAYADTDDDFYYAFPSNQPWNQIFETGTLRANADTYGCFLLDYYLRAPPG